MELILTTNTKKTRTLSIEHITDKFVYYEDHIIEVEDLSGKVLSENTWHGLTSLENIQKVTDLKCINDEIRVDWMYEHTGRIVAIRKDIYKDIINGKIHASNIYDYINFVNDPENYVYCIYNSGSWKLSDLDGNVIPLPEYFDYIDGRVNEKNFDIEALWVYLDEHKDKFIPCYHYNETEITIHEIPYYNRDEDTGKYYLQFGYLPTQEEADTMKTMDKWQREQYIINHSELKNFKRQK